MERRRPPTSSRWRCACSTGDAEAWLLAQAEHALTPEADPHAARVLASVVDHYVVISRRQKVGAE